MDDMISRAYVLAEYDRQHKGPPGGARKIIEEAPAVDAVPVMRCKDCKWRHDEAIEDVIPEEYYCRNIDCNVPGKFFCADGERREVNDPRTGD